MNYIYKSNELNQHICHTICHHKFNQIYASSNEIETMGVKPKKVCKQIISSSLIQTLKLNVDELEQGNQLLKSSLDFYKKIYYRNIEKLYYI
jgi:hypothetical protein